MKLNTAVMISLVTDRSLLQYYLDRLQLDSKPLWGQMNTQGMIEHLAELVEVSNGKRVSTLGVPPEKVPELKQMAIYSDFQIPPGAKAMQLPDKADGLACANIDEAKAYLLQELNDFDKYYADANKLALHPAWGELNYQEWQVWHGKHFLHHFKQFGLIE